MTTPPSRLPRPSDAEEEVLRVVTLLRAEGAEEKPLVATKDGRPTEAEAMILPLPSDEALITGETGCPFDVALYLLMIVGGSYSENAMRETRGKGTFYIRHQSETQARDHFVIVGGIYSETAMRKAKSKGRPGMERAYSIICCLLEFARCA